MGAKTRNYKVGDIEFYRVVKLGGFGWKAFFRFGDERWVGVIVARRFVANANAQGTRVTLQPLKRKDFRFSKNWTKVAPPAEKGEVRLLVWLTFNEMGVL